MTLIIGLTGSIATGKSTITQMFIDLGIKVIDADKIAREVVEKGKPAYEQIVVTFGTDILHEDQTIDRKALGDIVFNDAEKRKTLNNIIHPEIRKEMLRQRDTYVEAEEKCVVLDIPLLFESKLTHFVDKIIVVSTDESVQLTRLMERDQSTKESAEQRIQSQIPIAEKIKKADAVIDNNGTVEESYQQLENILKEWNVFPKK